MSNFKSVKQKFVEKHVNENTTDLIVRHSIHANFALNVLINHPDNEKAMYDYMYNCTCVEEAMFFTDYHGGVIYQRNYNEDEILIKLKAQKVDYLYNSILSRHYKISDIKWQIKQNVKEPTK